MQQDNVNEMSWCIFCKLSNFFKAIWTTAVLLSPHFPSFSTAVLSSSAISRTNETFSEAVLQPRLSIVLDRNTIMLITPPFWQSSDHRRPCRRPEHRGLSWLIPRGLRLFWDWVPRRWQSPFSYVSASLLACVSIKCQYLPKECNTSLQKPLFEKITLLGRKKE